MSNLNLRAVLTQLQVTERAWFNTLVQNANNTDGFIPSDSLLYGEIAFCVLDLKPAVLIHWAHSNSLTDQYVAEVLQSIIDLLQGTDAALSIQKVTQPLKSPHTGKSMFFRSSTFHTEPDILQETLLGSYILHKRSLPTPLQSLIQSTFFTNPSPSTPISESTLAKIFDYPTSLPTSDEDAMQNGFTEVVYLEYGIAQEKTVVTTYGARPWERQNVLLHFRRYKEAVERVGMKLECEIIE